MSLAVLEIVVPDPQLAEQRRGQVDLRGVLLHDTRRGDGPARPDHRNPVTQRHVVGSVFRIGIAVVGDQYDEEVPPRRRGFQPVDHRPDARIGEGHGVEHLVFEFRIGNVEGLVAAQRQQPRQKGPARGVERDDPVGEPVAHDRIVVAPVRGRRCRNAGPSARQVPAIP